MGVSVSKTKALQSHSPDKKDVLQDHKHVERKTNLLPQHAQYADEKLNYENLQFHENFDMAQSGFGSRTSVTFITGRNNTFKGHANAIAKNVSGLSKDKMKIMTRFKFHRNICPFLGFCQNGSLVVALIQNAEGGSLQDYLRDDSRPLPKSLINKWVKESLVALRFLHAYQCPHGNLKPSNSLLFNGNTLKLSDYGVSQENRQPHTTQVFGESIRYTAPELLDGRKGDDSCIKHADIYAYGMLILEMCSRKPPFYGMETESVKSQVTDGKHPNLPENSPEDLNGIIQRCWNADPKARPSSQTLVEELCDWSVEREIHPEDTDGKPLKANRVACCGAEGKLTVNGWWDNLYTLGGDGHKSSLLSPSDDHVRLLGRVEGIAVTQGYTFVVDGTKHVKVFDDNDKYLDCFSTCTNEDNPNMHSDLRCIATNRDGQILVGDCSRNVITTHTCPTGKVESKIKYNMTHTARMCVNSNNQILCHFRPDDTVLSKVAVISDVTGNEAFSFIPKIEENLENKKVRPRGIACDSDDNIYIAMCVSGTLSTGHIHKYTPTGVFLRCIVRDLYLPMDLDITLDGCLAVANKRSIRIYTLM